MRVPVLLVAVVLVAVLGLTAAAEEAKHVKLERFGGTITKVEEGKVTVVSKGESGEKTMTFTVDDKTKIRVPTGETEEVTGENGEKKTRPKMKDGTVADLKAEQLVHVGYKKDGNVAVVVYVVPPKPKEGGEGEKK